MDKSNKIILVSGATGHQGGAVARRLLDEGWQVRILTRNPDKPIAREFLRRGAEVVPGDFDDERSLDKALKGCYGAYSVQDFYAAGAEGEVRQGKNFARSANYAGVRHFVYSSVGSADRNTGIPHFATKWHIEQFIRLEDLSYTIIRPVFFMENFWSYQKDSILNGTLSLPMSPQRKLQLIAVTDIGGIAAMCFDEPDRFIGKALDIAGDELTMPEVASAIGDFIGREVRFQPQSMEQMKSAMPELAKMYEWFNNVGYDADIPAVRETYPTLLDFRSWLPQSEFANAVQAAG